MVMGLGGSLPIPVPFSNLGILLPHFLSKQRVVIAPVYTLWGARRSCVQFWFYLLDEILLCEIQEPTIQLPVTLSTNEKSDLNRSRLRESGDDFVTTHPVFYPAGLPYIDASTIDHCEVNSWFIREPSSLCEVDGWQGVDVNRWQIFKLHSFFAFFLGFLFFAPLGRPAGFRSTCFKSVSGMNQTLPTCVSSRVAFGNRPCLTQSRTLDGAALILSATSFRRSILTFFFSIPIVRENLSRLLWTVKEYQVAEYYTRVDIIYRGMIYSVSL